MKKVSTVVATAAALVSFEAEDSFAFVPSSSPPAVDGAYRRRHSCPGRIQYLPYDDLDEAIDVAAIKLSTSHLFQDPAATGRIDRFFPQVFPDGFDPVAACEAKTVDAGSRRSTTVKPVTPVDDIERDRSLAVKMWETTQAATALRRNELIAIYDRSVDLVDHDADDEEDHFKEDEHFAMCTMLSQSALLSKAMQLSPSSATKTAEADEEMAVPNMLNKPCRPSTMEYYEDSDDDHTHPFDGRCWYTGSIGVASARV